MSGYNPCSVLKKPHRTDRSTGLARNTQACLPIAVLMAVSFAAGCIERTLSINTEPEGATVILNDQEIGRSPVRQHFTWYGDYDIILRKDGYKTVQTHRNIRPPWYQYPLIDLVAEILVPFTIHDDRVLETFRLEPYEAPDPDQLIERADEMRARALSREATD